MKIAVVGCGAMGSVYAGLLASAGNEVWAISRPGAHRDAMARDGLRVTGASGDRTVRLNVATTAADAGVCDLVVLATKGPELSNAAGGAAPLVSAGTLVLVTQNGLGAPEIAAAALPSAHVAIGIAAGFGAAVAAPGHVHHNGWGEMRLGECRGPVTPALARVAEVWRSASFAAPTFDDIDRMVWEKLCVNISFDAVGTLHGFVIGEILASPEAWALSQACLAEAVAVARARGITLGFADPADHVRTFGAKIPKAVPSMLLDHRARRRSEIDALNGAVAKLARELGIPAPANEQVTREIKEREKVF